MINLALLSAAHIHTKGYLKDAAGRDDCKVVAIWDDVPDRGRRYAAEFGAEYTDDLAATIGRADIQGFIICAENTRHLPLLKAAVPSGKAVFCEKPFTTTVADAAAAMALIRKHKTPVHMGYFQPFRPIIRGVAKLLAEGAIGKVTHARFRNAHHAAYGKWFHSPDLAWFHDPALAGGGAMMDMGTHAVHALRSLLGPVSRVMGRIGNASGVYPAVDDCGIALLEFASGVLGTVEASWVQTGGIGGLEITGSTGTIYNDPKIGDLAVGRPKTEPVPVAPGDQKPTQLARLVATIKGEVTPTELADDLAAAADAVAIMEAIYASSKSGKWETVAKI